ncbi:putative portal protein [Escherichia coli O157:H7 str. LSU-61]|nr:putative portal protein [Escherichia coli O157:H7 str. LSU-61]
MAEPFSGAWQQGVKADPEAVLSFHAVFACISLISQDIAKMRLRLMQTDAHGIRRETAGGYCPSLSSSQCTAESYPVF